MRALLSRRALESVLGFAVALAGSTVGGRALAQPLPSDSAIRALLKTRVDSGLAKGMVVGVLQDGRRRFVAYGSAGPGRAPLDEHTIFEIGLISQTFSRMLLAHAPARGEGRIDHSRAGPLRAGTGIPS